MSAEYPYGIYAAAFHPGGKNILSGGMGNNLRLWDVATGREIRTLLGHTQQLTSMVTSIAFSRDGMFAVTAGGDGTLKVWDVGTWKEIRALQRHEGTVRSVAISADAKYALSGSNDMTVKLWDISTGKELRTFKGHTKEISSVSISPDGKRALSAGYDEKIRLWDVATGKEIKTLQGHTSAVRSVVFSADGKTALSGSDDKTLRLWDLDTGREFKTFMGHSDFVISVALSPDGKYALSGSKDNSLKLWDAATGREMRRFQGHSSAVTSVSFSPDGKHVLSASEDRTMKLWDVATGKEIKTLQGHVKGVRTVSVSHDGRYLVSGSADSVLKLWDIETGKEIRRFRRPPGTAEMMTEEVVMPPQVFLGMPDSVSAAFSPDGKYMISGTEDSPVTLRELATGNQVALLIGHEDLVPTVVFSSDSKYALSGSLDKTAKLWDIAKGKEIRTFKGHVYGVIAVAFSADGKYALSGARDSTVRVWEIATGKEIRSFKGYSKFVKSAAFSPDGKYVVFGTLDSAIKLLNAENGKEIRTFSGHSGMVTSVALSTDKKFVLSGGNDGTVRLWDAATGAEAKKLQGHSGKINSVVFSSDGKKIMSGGDDGTLRIWDVVTGKEIARCISFTNGEWITMTPEGYFNASSNGSRLVNVRIGQTAYSVDSFYERFYNPFVVAEALRGRQPALSSDIRRGFATPPEMRIVSPEQGGRIDKETVTVSLEAKDTGGGVDEILLYHNGSALGAGQTDKGGEGKAGVGKDGATVQKRFEVTLVPGDNLFRTVAFSRDRTASDPAETEVRRLGGTASSDLHLVVIGINDYKNAGLRLDFPVSGAQAIKGLFEKKWSNVTSVTHFYFAAGTEGGTNFSLFKNIHITELYDGDATREGIKARLSAIRANPQDVVVLYFGGQVKSSADEWYFVPYDGAPSGKEQGLSSSEIAALLRNTNALRKVVFFDGYRADGLTSSVPGQLQDSRTMALIGRATGAHVISTSTGKRDVAASTKSGQGVFADAVLRGLKGEAENLAQRQIPISEYSARDRIVTVKSLITYLEGSVSKSSEAYGLGPRSIQVYSRGQDFPLVINKWNE